MCKNVHLYDNTYRGNVYLKIYVKIIIKYINKIIIFIPRKSRNVKVRGVEVKKMCDAYFYEPC